MTITHEKLTSIITSAKPPGVGKRSNYASPDPHRYPRNVVGLHNYLQDAGVVYFTGKELATPHHPEIAIKQGWPSGYLIPPHACWTHGLACLTVADAVRALVGRPVRAANWWRPDPYNSAVASSSANSDHPNATALDLEFMGANFVSDHAKASKFLRDLYARVDYLALGIYPSGRRIHVGICTAAGRRIW